MTKEIDMKTIFNYGSQIEYLPGSGLYVDPKY